jgi:anti-anti-sigma regulatory factor
MLKISTVDTRSERRLVVEGKLVAPLLAELKRTWSKAGEELQGRKLVIDLRNVTVISSEGESALYELMQEGAKFSCSGVLTRHLLRRLAHRCQAQLRNINRLCSSD